MNDILNMLYNIIINRVEEPSKNSYTRYLFDSGLNKILKKCGEECSEVIIAAKDGNTEDIKQEVCDLIYHLMVMLAFKGITPEEIGEIIIERSQKKDNLKEARVTDTNC
ncbi:MAG TPA: phosphoribosyl-ATP diphosphatase [Bacillota bacterium]|nr:phosphoribosyl-ATP diphosphatase [Bacillota bacterium]